MPAEAMPFIEMTNLVVTILLFLKVAAMDQTLRADENIQYQGSPTINMAKGLKP